MDRADVIRLAQQADPEWLLPDPDMCPDEVDALERFAALVRAEVMREMADSGHSTARAGEASTTPLPCPFCGEEPAVSRWHDESAYSHATVEYMQIKCDGCCEGIATERHAEALEAWNTRTARAGEASTAPAAWTTYAHIHAIGFGKSGLFVKEPGGVFCVPVYFGEAQHINEGFNDNV